MSKRKCYYITGTDFVPGLGHIPALITEGEPGYDLAAGNGDFSRPYYWGLHIDDARAVAEKANGEDFGLTPDDARDIVISSFAASARRRVGDQA